MSNIEIIGVDLDNTLYPSTPKIQKRIMTTIYEKMYSYFNIPFEQARDLFVTHYAEFMSGSKTIDKIAELFGKKDYPDIMQQSLEETDFLDLIDENPRLRDMLFRLREKKELDLLTTSPGTLAFEKLKKLGIPSGTFYLHLTRENGLKITGELYKTWLDIVCCPPEQFLYVGDNIKQDIDAPKRLGIKTCLVRNEKYDNCDFHINNILELENLVLAI